MVRDKPLDYFFEDIPPVHYDSAKALDTDKTYPENNHKIIEYSDIRLSARVDQLPTQRGWIDSDRVKPDDVAGAFDMLGSEGIPEWRPLSEVVKVISDGYGTVTYAPDEPEVLYVHIS